MPTINNYTKYAETAFAAYANGLSTSAPNIVAYRAADMANPQADEFDQAWSVLAQTDIGNGFSAVLFQDRATGEKVLAIRGTEGSHWGMDYFADVVNIALLGTQAGMPQYNSLEMFYQQLVGTGRLGINESITVSGHSLGGFLAQAFTAKHNAVVTAAYTYNSPGFSVAPGPISNISTELLEFFGITDATIPSNKIFNARAVDGVSATSGLGQMIGTVMPFNIEAAANIPSPIDAAIHNHSIVTLTDSLAVQNALATLDP